MRSEEEKDERMVGTDVGVDEMDEDEDEEDNDEDR